MIEPVFFNDFELHMKFELFRSSYFGSRSYLVLLICMHMDSYNFRGTNLYTFQSSTVKLELENARDRFCSVSKMCMEITFKEITILIPKTFLTCVVLK